MKIVWSPRAAGHLEQIRDYIAEDDPAAAARIAEKILAAVGLLARHPGAGRPGRIPGTRELLVAGTPYIIPYRVRRERLELIAVFHGREMWRAKT